jgi:tRNA uridine 5-carbamoylmethylation protein Kti12
MRVKIKAKNEEKKKKEEKTINIHIENTLGIVKLLNKISGQRVAYRLSCPARDMTISYISKIFFFQKFPSRVLTFQFVRRL